MRKERKRLQFLQLGKQQAAEKSLLPFLLSNAHGLEYVHLVLNTVEAVVEREDLNFSYISTKLVFGTLHNSANSIAVLKYQVPSLTHVLDISVTLFMFGNRICLTASVTPAFQHFATIKLASSSG